jgi:hypothetical protein
VHWLDTSLAEWLLSHGATADPNLTGKRGTWLTDLARTRRMVELLHRFGATDNPYTNEVEPCAEPFVRIDAELKGRFR